MRMKIIPHGQPVPVKLKRSECDLIRHETFADPETVKAMANAPEVKGFVTVMLTLDDLDDLAGYVAASANHAENAKLQSEFDRVYEKLVKVLDSYDDSEDEDEDELTVALAAVLETALTPAELGSTNTWFTQMDHFLDENGCMPSDPKALPPIARFMGSIVADVSSAPANQWLMLDIQCRRRPGHKPCQGRIEAINSPATEEIQWFCPRCGDHGFLSGWEGTPWDRRTTAADSDPEKDEPQFTPAASRIWDQLPGRVRLKVLNNVFCVECRTTCSMELIQARVARGDLLLRGNCLSCGGEVRRLVEASE